jgi:hypothetical protein
MQVDRVDETEPVRAGATVAQGQPLAPGQAPPLRFAAPAVEEKHA